MVLDPQAVMKNHRENISENLSHESQRAEKRSLKGFKTFCESSEEKGGYNESVESVVGKMKEYPELVYGVIADYVKYEKNRWKKNRFGVEVKDENGNKIKAVSIATIKKSFIYINKFLNKEGIRTDNKQELKNIFGKTEKHSRIGITHEQMKHLFLASNKKIQSMVIICSSSGMRSGELRKIRYQDITKLKFGDEQRYQITLPAKITKTKQERITFISKEAEAYFEPLLKDKSGKDLILPLSKFQIITGFQKSVRDAGLEKKYEHSHCNTITSHSMRAFFITQLGKVDGFFSHALSGHGHYMKEYDRYSPEEKLEAFLKGEHHLQIIDRVEGRNVTKINQLQKNVKDQQETISELKEMLNEAMISREEWEEIIKTSPKLKVTNPKSES